MTAPPASKLVRRVLTEEIDAFAERLDQRTEEYVGGKSYVFRGTDSEGRRRDQIYVVLRSVAARTGVAYEKIAKRYPGGRELFYSASTLRGTYREDPDLAAAHERRMEAKRAERSEAA